MYKRKPYHGAKTRQDWQDNTGYQGSKPSEKEGSPDIAFSEKALRGLPKSAYSLQASPYEASLAPSTKYDIIAAFNKTVGGSYKGDRNLDGGNASQYASSSNSHLLQAFDFISHKVSLNYRYIGNKVPEDSPLHYPGKALVDEQIKAIAEATSILQATTFTAMNINKYVIRTSMPLGSVEGEDIDGVTKSTDRQNGITTTSRLDAVIYAASRFYQMFLLKMINALNWHNSFRYKQGTMIRSSWNREVPKLNALFGLFNKAAWRSFLQSICLSFEGEYIDTDFIPQMAMVNAMPSRRSDSINDPVLEIISDIELPETFQMYVENGANKYLKIFDLDDMVYNVRDQFRQTLSQTIQQVFSNFMEKLSACDTMIWARNRVTAVVDTETVEATPTNRYDSVKSYVDAFIAAMTTFKTSFSDVREVFNVMSRTGVVTWKTGFKPDIVKDNDAKLFHNLTAEAIFQIFNSGARDVTLNNATKRWETFSLWNLYKGIPEYDTFNGGAFLTLSFKNIISGNDGDHIGDYLPVAFSAEILQSTQNRTKAVARDGVFAYITRSDGVISNDVQLKRLVPLESQKDLVLLVPAYTTADTSTATRWTPYHDSFISKMLLQLCGFARVKASVAGSESQTTTVVCDPDIVSVYQIEIADITNDAIAYARANGPFRGTQSYDGILGFFGVSTK